MATANFRLGSSTPSLRAPSPPGHFITGHLGELKKDPIGMLLRARSSLGDIVRLKLWWVTAHLLAHPEHIQHVLQKKPSQYDKDLEPLRRMRPILGNGMVTADGASWERQRQVARPAFHQNEIQEFGPAITAYADDLANRWQEIAANGEIVDMHKEMLQITLRIAGSALFGVDLKDDAAASSDLLNVTLAAGVKRVNALIALPLALPTPNNRVLNRSRLAMKRMIDKIIERRQGADHCEEDLLARLLADHGALDPKRRGAQFYDEAITLLLAGHETTANALAFSLHLLGRHPSIMGKLREETRAVLGGRPAEVDDLSKLTYTRMVLDEAMRLYPPAWVIDRNAAEDDEIGGYVIPKGGLMLLSPYITHRHPAFWLDAERFDPSRFEKARVAERPRHAYFPFSFGPRVCIGMTFALTEATLVLATLIDRFEVKLIDGHIMTLDANVTLRPKNGLPMAIRAV